MRLDEARYSEAGAAYQQPACPQLRIAQQCTGYHARGPATAEAERAMKDVVTNGDIYVSQHVSVPV